MYIRIAMSEEIRLKIFVMKYLSIPIPLSEYPVLSVCNNAVTSKTITTIQN